MLPELQRSCSEVFRSAARGECTDDILEITTAWQDHCVVEYDYERSFMTDFELNVGEDVFKQDRLERDIA